MAEALVGRKLPGRLVRDDVAEVQDHAPIRNRQGAARVLLDQQDRQAEPVREPADQAS